MKQSIFICLLLMVVLCAIQPLISEEAAGPYKGLRSCLTIGFLPIGGFGYMNSIYLNGDPMINASIVYEYRLWSDLGIGGYFDLRGYRWHTIGSDDSLFGQIFGAPGITAGVMAVYHLLPIDWPLDINTAAGLGLKLYITSQNADAALNFAPGFDLTSNINCMYHFVPFCGLGARIMFSYSIHRESGDLNAFELREYAAGIAVDMLF